MPELPEVETVARAMRRDLLGRVVREARILWPREVNRREEEFSAALRGLRFQAVDRHGKYLIFRFAPPVLAEGAAGGMPVMLLHLKMSGRLDVLPAAQAITPHARVVWLMEDGMALRFEDARKFGRVWLADEPSKIIGKLGPDAIAVTRDEFASRLRRKKGALKPILLDQSFIAGVGNIYADESLWRARLHPRRAAHTLGDEDTTRLHESIQHVLREGLAANGASFDWVYPGGNFQENFRVYGQTDKPCARCGQPIRRILVGQRSTHFCEDCQK
jgi:formamidopyrimidine-DNA glycosylase